MQRRQVSSSNIRSIGYNKDYSILEVEFTSYHTYQYFGVSESVYNALMNASSHGSYLNQYIKDRYQYSKVN